MRARSFHHRPRQLFHFLPGDLQRQAFPSPEERNVHGSDRLRRQLVLHQHERFTQTRHLARCKPVQFCPLQDSIEQRAIHVIAPEARVAIRGQHFEDPVIEFQQRNIKGSPAQVVDRDARFRFHLVKPISQSGRRGLVHDSFHGESSELAGSLGRVALRVVKIGRHRDDGAMNSPADTSLRVCFELFQDNGGNLFRRKFAGSDLDTKRLAGLACQAIRHRAILRRHFFAAQSDEPFDRIDGRVRPKHTHARSGGAHDRLARLGEMNDRRRQARPFRPRDQDREARVHHADERVGRAQVNADDIRFHRAIVSGRHRLRESTPARVQPVFLLARPNFWRASTCHPATSAALRVGQAQRTTLSVSKATSCRGNRIMAARRFLVAAGNSL